MPNEGRLKIGSNFLKVGDNYLRIGPAPSGGGGAGGSVTGSARVAFSTPFASPVSADAFNMGGADAGDKYLIVTWSHAHDGAPKVITPSAPWLTGVTSLSSIEAADGEARDVFGSSYDVSAGSTRVEVWIADVDTGSLGLGPRLTLTDPATTQWPTGSEYGFGGYALLIHNPDPTTPIPQIVFATGNNGDATHAMAAPAATSRYVIVGFQRGIVGGAGNGDTGYLVTPGWTRISVTHQDIELSGIGELIHAGAQLLVVNHSAGGETSLVWGGAGVFTVSVAVEVKLA